MASEADEHNQPTIAMEPGAILYFSLILISCVLGAFFVTRHSNLSQVHIVLHLASDHDAVKNPGLVPIPVWNMGECVSVCV